MDDNPQELICTKEGFWVLKNDSHLSRWIEEEGRLDFHRGFTDSIIKHLKPGDTAVDIGAFVGDHTVAYAKAVGPTGRVLAFEPNPLTFEGLRRNMENYPWVECHNLALSDFPGEMAMEQDPNVGASRLVNGTGVKIDTLDYFGLEQCALIKTDAEGYDLRALMGGTNTIRRCRPVLIMEVADFALKWCGCSEEMLLGWLRDHKYTWDDRDHFKLVYDLFAFPPK